MPEPRSSAVVTAPCRHFGTCGGCDWQDVDYDEQCRLKREWVRRCLEQGLGCTIAVGDVVRAQPPSGAVPLGFRSKVHFVIGADARGALALGHYARASQVFVPVTECPVHAEPGNLWARRIVELLAPHDVRAYPEGPLRHVVVRVSSEGHAAAALVVSDDRGTRLRSALRLVATALSGAGVSFSVNLNNRPGPYLFGERTTHLGGPRCLVERVGGVRFQLSPTSFFQTNVAVAARLLADVRRVCASTAPLRIVDFYAGVGLFALPLSADGHEVTAVEEDARALADALATLRANRLTCSYVRASVDRDVARLRRALRTPADVLLLDPPRAGCGARALQQWLAHLEPARVIYVSCEPTSLARDLQGVVGRDGRGVYAIEAVTPYDMFPHTRHVECLVTLVRAHDRAATGRQTR